MSENYLIVLNKNDPNRCNCVLYARAKVPKLPFGLWTIWNKKNIINSKKAKEGNIAIINTGLPFGHLAFVTFAGKNHTTIQEANYRFCKITERHGSEKDLKIIGYFNPNI